LIPSGSPSDDSGRPPAGAVVRAETVRDLREATGEEAYILIRAEFLSSTERQLAAMALAAESGDAETLRRAAHALKGASGSLGADGLGALCRGLETRLAAGAPRDERLAAVAGLAAEFAAVRRALMEGA
jgi:HPt (histidine-containing phosphotransfer) domain-containing protein